MTELGRQTARRVPRVRHKVAGLFAGIGGLELGLHQAGHRCNLLCEIEPAAAHVLRVQFPKVPIVDDVRRVRELPIGTSLVTAGFPCQDLSSVGLKSGIEGAQSSLVDEVFRILEANDVDNVLFENVRFMLHLHGGKAMSRIAARFEELGYNWAYRVVNTLAFGLPQRRHRVFFLAMRRGDPRNVLLADDFDIPDRELSLQDPIGFYWTEGTYATGLAPDAIPPLKNGSTIGIPSPPSILLPSGEVGTPSISDAERLQGFPESWTKAAEEVARPSHRWKLIGNAVSVPVAKWVGERLAVPGDFCASGARPFGTKWPNAAWSIGGRRYVADVGDAPMIFSPAPSLASFLQEPLKPLSERALNGFLKRARSGRMRFPEGFLDALERYKDGVVA